jgi:Excalibur calcium-binding domain
MLASMARGVSFKRAISTLVLWVTVLVGSPGSATAATVPWDVRPIEPHDGGVYVVDAETTEFATEFQAPTVVTGGSQAVIEVSRESTLGQDGTLAVDTLTSGYGLLYKRDSDPTRWFGSFSSTAFSEPGSYYFQYSLSVLQLSSDPVQSCPDIPLGSFGLCSYASRVMAFQVVRPACSDGIDNDGDGTTDARDWGCDGPDDPSETLDAAGPFLTVAQGREFLRQKLRQRFGTKFANRRSYGVVCRRTLRRQLVCDVKWRVGNRRYQGPTRVTLVARGEAVFQSVDVSRVRSRVISTRVARIAPTPPSTGGLPLQPNLPGDQDCSDIGYPVRVLPGDPDRLDRDGDGIGCEAS